jgi:hypothetical protein
LIPVGSVYVLVLVFDSHLALPIKAALFAGLMVTGLVRHGPRPDGNMYNSEN